MSFAYEGQSCTITWSGAPATQTDASTGKTYKLDVMSIYVSGTINGSAYTYSTIISGSTSGSWGTSFGLGESVDITVSVSGQYGYYSGPNLVYGVASGSGSWYTGSPPPPPPAPPSPGNLGGLVEIDNKTYVKLTWNALGSGSGYTTYYNIYRTIDGGPETYLGNTASNTYTDNSPGSTRPITYRVQPYATGNGSTYSGSTYGLDESVVVPIPYQWSLWDGVQEIPNLVPSLWDGSKEIFVLTTQVSSDH